MIIYAVNIHTGGGKVLLDELLMNQPYGNVTALFHDERYILPDQISPRIIRFKFKPSLLARILAERSLNELLKKNADEFVLFFGNLPPIIVKPLRSALYLQNCFLLPSVKIETQDLKTYFRLWVEKQILRFRIQNVSEVWVQTEWMVRGMSLNKNVPVLKKLFLPQLPKVTSTTKIYDFISVTSTSKHKRLDTFLKSLELLSKKVSHKIKVLIIIDGTSNIPITDALKNSHIELTVLSNVSRNELFTFYNQSKTSVITSRYESLSLPIYESMHFGLQIICPNLEYTEEVRDRVVVYEAESIEDLSKKLLSAI